MVAPGGGGCSGVAGVPDEALIAAALADELAGSSAGPTDERPRGPTFGALDAGRLLPAGRGLVTVHRYAIGDEVAEVRVERSGDGYRVVVGDRSYDVRTRPTGNGALSLDLEGRVLTCVTAREGSTRHVALRGDGVAAGPWALERSRPGRRRRAGGGASGELVATMPGSCSRSG